MYDVLIVGGGLVGASLACALQHTAWRIAVIEKSPWFSQHQSLPSHFDERVLALSYTSQQILKAIGVWEQLAAQTTPIEQIHVSEQGQFGFTHLDCQQLGVPALGYVVSARTLGQVLQQSLSSSKVTIFAPATWQSLQCDDDSVTIQIFNNGDGQNGDGQTLQTRLLVAADGDNSPIRSQLGIFVKQQDYGQTAIIANLTFENPNKNMAYERFTASGPLAILPLHENDANLVWTVASASTEKLLNLSDTQFLHSIQQEFGWRLGRILKVGKRYAYPLRLLKVSQLTRSRIVLIGNAAHTLHPVGGQGFNLGLRDVSTLASAINQSEYDVGSETVLEQYVAWQQPDQKSVISVTDTLVRIFSNKIFPLVVARNLGLLLVETMPSLKKYLMRQMAGFNGYPSKLVRGLPLDHSNSRFGNF